MPPLSFHIFYRRIEISARLPSPMTRQSSSDDSWKILRANSNNVLAQRKYPL